MWFKIEGQQVKISIIAKPNAKKTAFLGISEQGLIISLHEKPDQGAANKELITFLAKQFRVPKNQIILHRGERSRYKKVIVPLTENVQKWLNFKI